MLFFGTGGVSLSGVIHLHFTEENYKKLDDIKQSLNITYTQQFAYIFFELSKQDFGQLSEIAKNLKEQNIIDKFTIKRTIKKERLDMLTFQSIYEFTDRELPNLFEKKTLMEILLNHYVSNSYVYSDDFLSLLKKKNNEYPMKNYTLRVDDDLVNNFNKHIKSFGVRLQTFVLLNGIGHQESIINQFSYVDFVNARNEFCCKNETKLYPLQFKTTACLHPLLDNVLSFNLSEIAELLMMYELKYPNRSL